MYPSELLTHPEERLHTLLPRLALNEPLLDILVELGIFERDRCLIVEGEEEPKLPVRQHPPRLVTQ